MRFATPVPALVAVLAMLLATAPAASAARCTGAKASASQVSKKKLVRATLCVLNAERRKRGLRPLRLDKRLSRAARMHSRAMARNSFFSHDSPTRGGFVKRVRKARYKGDAGENLGIGAPTVAMIVQAWLGSPTHKANILHKRWKYLGSGLIAANPTTPAKPGATWVTVYGNR